MLNTMDHLLITYSDDNMGERSIKLIRIETRTALSRADTFASLNSLHLYPTDRPDLDPDPRQKSNRLVLVI